MKKSLWIRLALLLVVIPGLFLTVSCAKKTVQSTAVETPAMTEEEAARRAAEEDENLARQRAIEEARLQEERLMTSAARERFEMEDVYFAFDRSDLSEEAQQVLRSKAEWLRSNPHVSVTVEGHCDERGTTEYNLALGERRAASVNTFLTDLGVEASRLTTVSYGEERPVDPRHVRDAWAKNRRAHFVIK